VYVNLTFFSQDQILFYFAMKNLVLWTSGSA